jgi:hypothetical protein
MTCMCHIFILRIPSNTLLFISQKIFPTIIFKDVLRLDLFASFLLNEFLIHLQATFNSKFRINCYDQFNP